MWSSPPKLRTWMPPLTAAEKRERGLPAGQGAYLVKWINRAEPGGEAVFDSGVREGDVLVAFEGDPLPDSDGEPKHFHAAMKLKYKVGDTVTMSVLRDGQRHDFEVELVE
jgi:S1-C subfamily serine protease